MLVGPLELHVQTKAGRKFLGAVSVLEDFHTDMVLGADYILSSEVQLTIDGGRVKLCCWTLSIFLASDFPVGRPQSQVSSKESRLVD